MRVDHPAGLGVCAALLMRLLFVTATLAAIAAGAAERPLSFTVNGELVAPGTYEMLLSMTPRFGRPEPFVRLENLVGFAYGFSARVEAQLLLAIAIEELAADERAFEGGAATRWRWKLLDGREAPVGVDLIGTALITTDSVFVEGRVGVEKWLGSFLFALNVSVDYLIRRDAAPGPDTHFEQNAGIAYQLENRFTTGFELRNRLGLERGNYFGDAIFAGPVFGFRGKSWWINLAALPQVAAVKAPALRGNGEALEVRDNERFVLRLQLGLESR